MEKGDGGGSGGANNSSDFVSTLRYAATDRRHANKCFHTGSQTVQVCQKIILYGERFSTNAISAEC
jgi:hypothetical protein